MRIHFISIGGSAMHSLALALFRNEDIITGSDDEIFEPSKSKLALVGLLPEKMGWDPERINSNLDAVILGMHARADNVELLKAKELGIPVFSYPEFIYHRSSGKKRVVIAGSHGKTTCTAMIMHVLKTAQLEFDYLVGAKIDGFEESVKITDKAPIIILEGDEYLSSPIDRRPKFILYQANLALLTGIAWDHINVFPSFEIYQRQFLDFLNSMDMNSTLVYCSLDPNVVKLVESFLPLDSKKTIKKIPYGIPKSEIKNGISYILGDSLKPIPLKVFGSHNLVNLQGAYMICKELGVEPETFYQSISTFKGADRRLELLGRNRKTQIFVDFAHAPSKIKATLMALKNQFPNQKLLAIMELHTFSSLNSEFIKEYSGTMDSADEAIVYFNPQTLIHKNLPPILPGQIRGAFYRNDLVIMDDSLKFRESFFHKNLDNYTLVFMSSGNFDGINLKLLSEEILNPKINKG